MKSLQTDPDIQPETIIRAQQDERERIGHELHDNVNQILTSAYLYLTVLTRESPEFEEVRKRTMDVLKMGIDAIRRLSKEMVMADLKEEGLIGSIRNLVRDLYNTRLFNILFVHSDISRVESLDGCRKVTLFRMVQELVKNIVNYSQSKNIQISLHCMDDQIRLQVRDDGIGFDPATTKRGIGLSNIYERTRLYNGKVLLDSAPGKGCSLIVNIPYALTNLC